MTERPDRGGGGGSGHKRVRSLLRNYYGIGEEEAEKPRADPTSIDDAAFDVERFVDKELQTKNLQKLIRTQTQMTKDIRQLDSSMKTLVYENYNKFISATDTIRQMRQNVSEMEEEMQRLASNMENITRCTEEISSNLAPHRETIEKLSGVSNLLQKRQFLFELPSRLTTCIERGSFGQAVKYHNGCKNILDKYDNLPSFKAISSDCEEIIGKMKRMLRDRLAADNVMAKEVTDCVQHLLDLEEESAPLREQFVTWRVANVKSQLKDFADRGLPSLSKEPGEKADETERAEGEETGDSANDAQAEAPGDETANLSEAEILAKSTTVYLQHLNNCFLRELLDFTESYFMLFVVRENDPSQADRAEAEFDMYAHDLFSTYSLMVQEKILIVGSVPAIIECLGVISNAFASATPSVARKVDLKTHTATTITSCIRAFMQQHFDACASNIKGKILSLAEYGSKEEEAAEQSPTVLCNEVSAFVSSQVVDLIVNCREFFEISTKHFLVEHCFNAYSSLKQFVEEAIELVMDLAESYRQEVAATATKRSTGQKSGAANPTFVLMLARMCLALSESSIGDIEKAIRKVESLVRFVTPNSRLHLLRFMETKPLLEQLGDVAQKLASSYVQSQGTRVSQMIRTGVDTPDWLKAKEPREVRLVINMVLSELKAMSVQISLVFDANKGRMSSERGSSGKTFSAQEQSIKKIFEQKVQIFGGKLQYNTNSILMGITKIVLKSFAESVRLRTFNRYGYQQMQVDTTYFRSIVDYVDNTKLINSMLDDIVASATVRCIDPVPMEDMIVTSICEKAKQ